MLRQRLTTEISERVIGDCRVFNSELKRGEQTMDIEGLLLGSGFALMLVLLGWASQITSKSKETKDLEAEFLHKAKLKRPDYRAIVNEGGATEDSFLALVEFLYSRTREDVAIFEKIKYVKSDLGKLDKKYNWRFWLLLCMSISFFISGITAFILPAKYEYWIVFPNLGFIVLVFVNLVAVHKLEKQYTKNINDAMERL